MVDEGLVRHQDLMYEDEERTRRMRLIPRLEGLDSIFRVLIVTIVSAIPRMMSMILLKRASRAAQV